MLNREKQDKLLALLGELTEEQKAIVTEALEGPINETELFGKLGVDEGKFTEFMHAFAARTEDVVLGQEVSLDEMEGAAGGADPTLNPHTKVTSVNCTQTEWRDTYKGGFPNCAATVEDGSWCSSNDACHNFSVKYANKKSCSKAWK